MDETITSTAAVAIFAAAVILYAKKSQNEVKLWHEKKRRDVKKAIEKQKEIERQKKQQIANEKRLKSLRRDSELEKIKGEKEAVKYELYSDCFKYNKARDLYQKIVVANLHFEEPFHGTFVNIVRFIFANRNILKSPRSKEVFFKENDKTLATYKVVYLADVLRLTLIKCREYISSYIKADQQVFIIAILLSKIDLVLHNKKADEAEILAGLLLDMDRLETILVLKHEINDAESDFNFVNKLFEKAKEVSPEDSYVEREIPPQPVIWPRKITKNDKKLMSIYDSCR